MNNKFSHRKSHFNRYAYVYGALICTIAPQIGWPTKFKLIFEHKLLATFVGQHIEFSIYKTTFYICLFILLYSSHIFRIWCRIWRSNVTICLHATNWIQNRTDNLIIHLWCVTKSQLIDLFQLFSSEKIVIQATCFTK